MPCDEDNKDPVPVVLILLDEMEDELVSTGMTFDEGADARSDVITEREPRPREYELVCELEPSGD